MVSSKILCSTTVFNIDNNQKCFLSSKSAYYYDFWRSCGWRLEEWCWKYRFDHSDKLHFNILISIYSYSNNISFSSNKCSLDEQKRLISKKSKLFKMFNGIAYPNPCPVIQNNSNYLYLLYKNINILTVQVSVKQKSIFTIIKAEEPEAGYLYEDWFSWPVDRSAVVRLGSGTNTWHRCGSVNITWDLRNNELEKPSAFGTQSSAASQVRRRETRRERVRKSEC